MKPPDQWEDSLYDEGDQVTVHRVLYTYRKPGIKGATGTVIEPTFDRNAGWSYRVKLDDPAMYDLASPGKSYGWEGFSEGELRPPDG